MVRESDRRQLRLFQEEQRRPVLLPLPANYDRRARERREYERAVRELAAFWRRRS